LTHGIDRIVIVIVQRVALLAGRTIHEYDVPERDAR
jgi:hypothetical protein